MPFIVPDPPGKDSEADYEGLDGPSGSGDGSEVYYSSTPLVSELTSLSETAPAVDQLDDDETTLYLYVLAAVVAAIVVIFVVVILIVSIRKQARDKKMTQRGDRANLLTVEIQTEAPGNPRGQVGQPTQPADLPDARTQAWTIHGHQPLLRQSKMATTQSRLP